MMRWILSITALLLLQWPISSAVAQAETPKGESVRLEGLEFTMIDEDPTQGNTLRKPKARFRADLADLYEFKGNGIDKEINTKTYTLQGVSGTIYGKDSKDFQLKADKGTYNENLKTITLEGSVIIQSGSMLIKTESVTWYNEEDILVSNSPVLLQNGETQLTAQSFKVNRAEKKIILQNSVGTIKTKD